MHRRIEDFSFQELVQRTALQEKIAAALHSLQDALDRKDYNDALFHNLDGHRMLADLVGRKLALEDEFNMLDVLRHTAGDILRLQQRLQ